ncbi:CUB and sushi domain-containing protein 3 [Caerostris extrusa]|uniref:CUB and sushi domain-containing protein 3 n=1 Tax=Caerostris extrusa TaxID=172846 RepID=A0AAV4VYU9_CAEEX|nr:CUB and sushi domain-containing protein 3 [Caerostris extrusa]
MCSALSLVSPQLNTNGSGWPRSQLGGFGAHVWNLEYFSSKTVSAATETMEWSSSRTLRYICGCTVPVRMSKSLPNSRSPFRVCRSDGTWSGQSPACELELGCTNCNGCPNNNCGGCPNNNCGGCPTNNCGGTTCPALFAPDNGHVEGGQSRLTCLTSGAWSSYTPYCRRTSGAICQFFNIPNGEADCVVTCNPGYMLVGSSLVTCSSSGSCEHLSRSTPEVTNICPTLNAPEGGRLVGSCTAANSGDTCQLVCISGYRPTDTRVLICQTNGQWSNSLPRCTSNGCPNIQVPNAALSGACSPGVAGAVLHHYLPGRIYTHWNCNLFVKVADNGHHRHPLAQFALVRLYRILSMEDIPVPVVRELSASHVHSTAMQVIVWWVHQSSLWKQWAVVRSPPQCAAPTGCPGLNPPANGAVSGSCQQVAVGQACSFSCQAGYTLSGQATLFCQAGGGGLLELPHAIEQVVPVAPV